MEVRHASPSANPSEPLVSILTPSYNQGRFIQNTVESVLGQDYPHVEHIISDGGSTDQTLTILAAYGSAVQSVSEPDRGQADALNKAFYRARGSIIGWLNSDDFYLWDGVLSQIVYIFEQHPAADVVYGHAVWVDDENRVVKIWPRPTFSASRLSRFDYISQPATFFRRTAIDPPLVDSDLHYVLDYDLWLRLLRAKRTFLHAPIYVAAMRSHADAKSTRARVAAWDEAARFGRARRTTVAATIGRLAADLGVMGWLRLRSLADFRPSALYASRWTVQLTFPPPHERPLYQFGLRGQRGTTFLLPRFLLHLGRR